MTKHDPSDKPRVGRRHFLETLLVTAGAASAGLPLSGCAPSRPAVEVFPQSVASGDPRPDSIVLWTRAVDVPDMPLEVQLEVATDPEFGSTLALSQPTYDASTERDHCVRTRHDGLDAVTPYHHRTPAAEAR
ncbi:MAG: PhoD-like phosphatase N-terminal domain-containing protein, partial [Sandaracinaceae bacterium]